MNYGEGYSLADIATATGNNRNNTGIGDGNGWWIILFLIVLFGGWGNRGYGGFGGGEGSSISENYVLTSDFSQLSRQLSDGFNSQERKLDSITNGLCDGFYTNAQLINGVNTNILTTGNGIQTQIADVGYAIKDCCCTTQRNIDSVKYENAQNTALLNNALNAGFTGVQQTMCLNTRDVIDSQNAGTRAILDAITANRIEDKNNQIAMLQTQLNNAELRASQEGQTREIINTIRPCPIPAYQSCNPWGCNCNQGCGCNM